MPETLSGLSCVTSASLWVCCTWTCVSLCDSRRPNLSESVLSDWFASLFVVCVGFASDFVVCVRFASDFDFDFDLI